MHDEIQGAVAGVLLFGGVALLCGTAANWLWECSISGTVGAVLIMLAIGIVPKQWRD